MKNNIVLDNAAYDPNRLLDFLIEKTRAKNDLALSRKLDVAAPVLSKIRHRRMPVGATLLLRMHEICDVSIADVDNRIIG